MFKMVKLLLYKQAVEMRKAGNSYSDIKNNLNVSKSTLSNWLSGIPYVPNKKTIDKIKKLLIKSL